MGNHSRRHKAGRAQTLTLPELDQSKSAVLNSLGSLQSRRSYRHAMEEFIAWYCSEPRLVLNRSVVLAYRQHLEGARFAPATINVRLAAIRRLTYEASDRGLLGPELVAGIGHPRSPIAVRTNLLFRATSLEMMGSSACIRNVTNVNALKRHCACYVLECYVLEVAIPLSSEIL